MLDTSYGRFQLCSNVPYSVSRQLFSPKEGSRKLRNLDYMATATLCVRPTSAKRHGMWNVQTQPNPLYIITQSFPMLPKKQHITSVTLPGISSRYL